MIKALRGTPKHLSRTGKLDSFTYLMMTLPFECNQRCPKCFNLNGNVPTIPDNPISLEDRVRLIGEARELGGRVVVIAGEGEPLISKGIKPLIEEIDKAGMIPIVYTNGSTLNESNIDFCKKRNVSLVISFDSLREEVYDNLTGTKGRFASTKEKILRAVDSFKPLIERKDDLELHRVAVNTTVTSQNENEIGEIKKFFGENVYFICNPLARFGNAIGNWDKLIASSDSYQRQQKLVKELSESGGPLTLGSDGLCGYSIQGISVGPNGDYMTCAYTPLTNGLFGNIRTKSLKDAFEYKHKMETGHYKQTGVVPCLVRAPTFGDYLNKLKAFK